MKYIPVQNYRKNGFAALTSVIIICAILLLVATTLSFTGFYGRYNILESEYKERSITLADACVDTVLLKMAQASSIATPLTITVSGSDTCTIKTFSDIGSQKVAIIQATYQGAYTNLEVKINASDGSIASWVELPTI